MADEKKLDLSALGLEQEATPAEKAAENAKEEVHVEKVGTKTIKDGNREINIEIIKSDIDPKSVESDIKPIVHYDKSGNPMKVVRPVGNSGDAGYNNDYTEIKNINSIAKNPITKKKDPIKETMNGLYGKADEGIKRAMAEATKPGGRIDEAKHKYIDTQYALLAKRAKNSNSLKKKIDAINDIIDTDPRFDGITDYERKGYIVFKVAHDEKVGINDESFGIAEGEVDKRYRNSHEAAQAISKHVSSRSDTEINDEKFVIGEDATSNIPFKEDVEPTKPEEKKEDKPIIDLPKKEKVKEKVVDEEDTSIPVKEDEETDIDVGLDVSASANPFSNNSSTADNGEEEFVDEDTAVDEDDVEFENRIKRRKKEFNDQVDDVLNIKNMNHALDDYEIGSPVSVAVAINHKKAVTPIPRITWGLQYTGKSFDMTPYSGEELIQFSKDPKEFEQPRNLETIFTIMYNHYVVPNKPKYDSWLRQISNYDIPCLMFGMYLACYGKSNYMPYECSNPKCNKIFLEKKEPLDMLTFPSDEAKARFQNIINKTSVSTKLYRTRPIKINDRFSISLVTPSIWSGTFEQAYIPDSLKTKFSNLTTIMPYIDCIFLNDNENKKLNRVMFGAIENDKVKTVVRKIKGLASIFKTFTSDELNRITFEIGKIATSLNEDQISYHILATTCPDCQSEISQRTYGPLELLFIRAQLLTMKAIIPE